MFEKMISRIGIDICGVERMSQAVNRSGMGFLTKCFTPAELDYCAGLEHRLAGRWAAKEAVIKCFDRTQLRFARRQIEILNTPGGAPRVNLVGDAKGAEVEVSITHQAGVAVATALLTMPENEPLLPPPKGVRIPDRPPTASKWSFGQVVVVAGSLGYTGAAYLAATAAARSGAGMVRLLVPNSVYPILATKCTEVIVQPLTESSSMALGLDSLETILESLSKATVGIVGPGLGRAGDTVQMVHELVRQASQPLVLDADALNALAERRELLNVEARPASPGKRVRILTPHIREMSRLSGVSVEEIEKNRLQVARRWSQEWNSVLVLKGANTVVSDSQGNQEVDPHQLPALASGGTGDVLSGVIAGLLAQGLEPFNAALSGVYLHAAAGRRVVTTGGQWELLASDLLPVIPKVMNELAQR